MKYKLLILLIGVALIFASCQEDDMTLNGHVDTSKVSIVASYRTADVQWKITCNADIDDVWAEYASDSTFADFEQKKMTMVNAKENDGQYKVSLTSLKDGQTYYLRCRVSNRYSSCTSEPRTFQTKAYQVPKLQTDSVTDITFNFAILHATLLDWGQETLPQVGFCYAKHADVSTADKCITCTISGTQQKIGYFGSIDDLEDGVTYYVRAYAKNKKGVGYGKEIQFTTQEILLPSVDKIEVTDKSYSYVICCSNVLSDGGQVVTERGICYALSLNPTISDNVVKAGSGTGAFSCQLSNLVGGTTYYARAYATNSKGTAYGPFSQAITTTSYSAPTVTYTLTSNITCTSATCHGNVTASGGLTVISRGVCYSPTSTPTISDSTVTSGTGTGLFTCSLTGLTPGTKYYVRSFAINSEGTSYSDQVTFTTTATTPTVTTSTATSITTTTASCGGNVTSDGGASVTSRGVCYSTSSNPTISNSKVISGSGTGSYTCSLTGLTPGTKYYVRAYATNSAGTSYGNEVTFTTTATKPTVTTSTATSITATTASCGGNVTSDGGLTVTARGVCYSTSSNPTISNSKVTSGTGTGSFTCNLTGLTEGTTYYIRAYATNSKGTAYGTEKTFTTTVYSKPIVTTTAASNITQTTATCGGNVTADGGQTVTARGVCYSTTSNPTISNSKVTSGSGTGSFTCNLTGLTEGTTYYIRAYATNSKGTAYGTEKTFTTTAYNKPTVTTSSATNITQTTATCGGNVTADGGQTVTARGVCYSTTSNPTISNSKVTSGTGTGSFTCNLTGLKDGTTYYVRAYATNSKGTAYGTEKTFTTTADLTTQTITYTASAKLTETTATYSSGLHTGAFNVTISSHTFSNGTGTIIFNDVLTSIGDRAFYGCSGLTSVTIPNSVTSIGGYAFFSCDGLTSVTIPSSVTSIGGYAFRGCSSLTSVTIPSSVKSIGTSPFSNCSNLTSINVASGNSYYRSSNGVLFNYNMTELIQYPAGKSGSYSIPNSVTSIGNNAFYGCSGLTSVTIPNSVTSIGDHAFYGCTGLTSPVYNAHVFVYIPESYSGTYTIPDGIESIARDAFYWCTGLTSVTIPNSVTSIGIRAFYHCTGLTSVTIPNSVTSIGSEAFEGCSGLTSVTIPNSVTSIGSLAFGFCTGLTSISCNATTPPTCSSYALDEINKSIPVYVPASSVNAYKAATGWKDFTNIQPL